MHMYIHINDREELLCKVCATAHRANTIQFSPNTKYIRIRNTYEGDSNLMTGVSVVSLDKSLEVNHISARVGDNVEIKCDVTGTPPPPLIWRRYGTDVETLSEPEVYPTQMTIRFFAVNLRHIKYRFVRDHYLKIKNANIYIYI